MKKIATILVAAISLGAAALLMSSSADARWVGYGGWHGWGYGWGYRGWGWGLAPFAAGAVIGGALAAPYYYPYGPYPYYYYYYPYASYAPYPRYYYYGYRPGCCW